MMIAFQTRLFLKSFLWSAPTFTLLAWQLLTLTSGGSALDMVGPLFPAFLFWGAWTTIALGNMSDTPMRDMLAAALGSTKSHHRTVVLTIACITPATFAAPVTYLSATGGPERIDAAVAMVLTAGSGVALGTATGTWLHRPIVTNRNVTIFVSLAITVGLLIFPPTTAALRALSNNQFQPLLVLSAASVTALIVSSLLSSHVADRRASTL